MSDQAPRNSSITRTSSSARAQMRSFLFRAKMHFLYEVPSSHGESELPQIAAQLVSHTPEQSEPLFFGAGKGRRILEIVMQFLRIAKVHRASFAGVVANSNNVVELLCSKFFDVLRTMSPNINADFVHYGNRFRAHEAGFRARAFYFEALSVIMPQETFGHLTPC